MSRSHFVCLFVFTAFAVGTVSSNDVLQAGVGQQIKLHCDTRNSKNVSWWFQAASPAGTRQVLIYDERGNTAGPFPTKLRSYDSVNHDILINNLQLTNTGVYSCIDGDKMQYDISVNVSEYLSLNIGERLELHCYSTESKITWKYTHRIDDPDRGPYTYIYRDAGITNDFSDRVTVSQPMSGDSKLVVLEGQFKDTGIYTCTENGQEHSVKVMATKRAGYGTFVSMPCHSSNENAVEWWRYKDFKTSPLEPIYRDGQIISAELKGRYSVDSTSHNISIRQLHFPDSGIFVCVEDAGLGKKHYMELTVSECASLSSQVVSNSVCTAKCVPDTGEVYEWRFESIDSKQKVIIYQSGTVLPQYKNKVEIKRTEDGSFVMTMEVESSKESGLYKCVEKTGITHCFNMSITLELSDIDTNEEIPENGTNTAIIIAVVGSLLALVAIISVTVVVCVWRRNRRKKRAPDYGQGGEEMQNLAREPVGDQPPGYYDGDRSVRPIHDQLVKLASRLKFYVEANILISSLMDRNILSDEQMAIVSDKETVFEKVQYIIDCFRTKSEDDHKQLLSALSETNQQHVVNYVVNDGRPTGDDRPLDMSLVRDLRRHILLEDNMLFNIENLVNELVRNGCLVGRHEKYILQNGDKDRVRTARLVEVISRRSVRHYNVFVECLRNTGNPVGELLSPGQNQLPDNDRADYTEEQCESKDQLPWDELIIEFHSDLDKMMN